MRLVVWPTLGNHDGYTADSDSESGPYYDIFTMPTAGETGGLPSGTESYYAFDYGPLHVTVIDQEVDFDSGSAQYSWIEQDLSQSAAPWKFVLLHTSK